MIYTIESGNRVVALTNERTTIEKFSNCTMRWSNESERQAFRQLESRRKQRHWLRDKINAALAWLWRISFPVR